MKYATYPEFKTIIIRTRDSVSPFMKLDEKTVKFWYDEFFRFYSKKILADIFNHIAESFDRWPSLKQMLEVITEFGFNPPVHTQIKKMKNQEQVDFIPSQYALDWEKK